MLYQNIFKLFLQTKTRTTLHYATIKRYEKKLTRRCRFISTTTTKSNHVFIKVMVNLLRTNNSFYPKFYIFMTKTIRALYEGELEVRVRQFKFSCSLIRKNMLSSTFLISKYNFCIYCTALTIPFPKQNLFRDIFFMFL